MNLFQRTWIFTKPSLRLRSKLGAVSVTILKASLGVFLLAIIITGCNKPSDIGSDVFDDDSLGILVTEDFDIQIKTHVRPPELIFSGERAIPNTQLIGELNDEYFGYSRAEVYTQLNFAIIIEGNPIAEAIIDSARIILKYDSFGLYGNLTEVIEIQVFELIEGIDVEVSYNSNQTFDTEMNPLTTFSFTPKPYDSIYITELDTNIMLDTTSILAPRLYIPVDVNSMNNDFVERLQALDSIVWAQPDSFKTIFKGLHFKLSENNHNTMLGFNFENNISQFNIYYKLTGDTTMTNRTLSFKMDGNAAKTSYYHHDYAGSDVGDILKDSATTITDTISFLQEMQGLSPKITISGLSVLHNTLINSAELQITINDLDKDSGLKRLSPSLISIEENRDSLVDIIDVRVAKFESQRTNSIGTYIAAFGGTKTQCEDSTQIKYIYKSEITSHLQDVISNQQDTATIFVSSFYQPESPRRAFIYGSETKYPVKLIVRYTKVL